MSSPHLVDLISPQTRLADLVRTPPKPEDETFIQSDNYNLVKISLFILGTGVEISPNALLLCARYYYEEYPNLPELIYYILPVYSISNIIFTVILTRSKLGTKLSFTLRIVISFLVSAITLFGLVQSNMTWDLIILILIVFIIGMTSAILNRSILGFTNILEKPYKHIFISGEALSGVIATIIRVTTRICYSNNVIGSSNIYFIIIASYCIFCALLFTIIRFTNYVAFRLNIYVLYIAQYKSIATNHKKKPLFSPYTQNLLNQQHNNKSLNQLQTNETSSENNTIQNNNNNNNDSNEEYLNSSLSTQTNDNLSIITTSTIDDDIIICKRRSTVEQYEKMDAQSSSDNNHTITTLQSPHNNNNNNNNTIDISNFLSSLHYKPNNNANNSSLMGGSIAGHSAPNHSLLGSGHSFHSMPLPYNYMYKTTNKNKNNSHSKRTYSSLLFNDIHSNKFFEISLIKRIKIYCVIVLISNILTWSIIPGLISGQIKSDLPLIAENDWESILLMSEYFISQYIGQLIISKPEFWWFCCQYSNNSNKKQIIIRNLGCCPICCGKSNYIISYSFLICICILRIILIYPIFFIVYTNLLKNEFDFMAHFLMIFIGITQGYIYHMVFMLAPQFIQKYKKEIATSILRFFHFTGIAIGSILALIIAYIVKYAHLNV